MSRYILGSEEMFHNFVNSLSKEDKIGVITHTDLDGIASGIFLQKILESKGLKIEFIEFLDYSPGSFEKVFSKEFNVLVFTDWKADDYEEELGKIREKSKVLVFDHHPFNPELKDKLNVIKTQGDYCSSHALFDLAKNGECFDTKDFEWLVCSAMIADYTWDKDSENFEFIKSIYPKIKKDLSIWDSVPGKIGKKVNSALIYYSPYYKKVYELVLNKKIKLLDKAEKIVNKEIETWIEKFKKEAEYFPEQKLYFAYGNPRYNIVSTLASILSDKDFRESTVIFLSDVKDKESFVKLSARNQTGKVDLGQLLKKCVEGLENADAGGHVRASAGFIMKKDLGKFKEKLLAELK